MGWYRRVALILAGALLAMGAVLVVRGVVDGNVLGIVVGALLLALGAARIQLERRRRAG
jgi:uncharacterized membrane protein HdeD (DUF308 family)